MKHRKFLCFFLTALLTALPIQPALAAALPSQSPAIQLNQTTLHKHPGDTFTLSVKPKNIGTIRWSSSNPASVLVTAGKVVCRAPGSAVIKAAAPGGQSATCVVQVTAVALKRLALTPAKFTLGVGETRALKAVFTPASATDKSLAWVSADPSVARVTSGGMLTGIKDGVAKVTATSPSGLTAACTVTVKTIAAKGVKLARASYKGNIGEVFTLAASVQPANASCKTVTWSTSDAKVATVSAQGEIKLTGPGSAVVTARTPCGKVATCKITTLLRFNTAHYYQGDSRWKFPRKVRKEGCMISSFAILITNVGVAATPRDVYNANHSTSPSYKAIGKAFSVHAVNALSAASRYLKGFNGYETTIKDPAKNYVAAVKEALDRNPEGVCVYFRRGNEAHMVVAIGYYKNDIYYSDPGRAAVRGCNVKFPDTWVYHGHKMTYKNLQYIVALDKN